MTSREIRQKFLDHFAKHGHAIVPSAPMVTGRSETVIGAKRG